MLIGKHTLLYSSEPAATRAFCRDVLQWPFVSEGDSDAPSEWLIFGTGPSEMGVHPASGDDGQRWADPGRHEVSLICDDIVATVQDLRRRGAEFDGEPEDLGFGLGAHVQVPGAGRMLIYEPRHPTAYDR